MLYLSILVAIVGVFGFVIASMIFPATSSTKIGLIAFVAALIVEAALLTIIHMAASRTPEDSTPFHGKASNVILESEKDK